MLKYDLAGACFAVLAGTAALLSPTAARAKSDPLPTLHGAIGSPDDFKLSGSVRVRYEALDGQFRPGLDHSDDLVSLRTTLFAEYDSGPIRIGAELYDSRAYDSEPGGFLTTGEVNTVELVQAYVAADLAEPFGTGSSATLQAGRFTLNLGSRRLVAADDYRNTTNGYTGLRADFRTRDGTTGSFIYVLPQIRRPDSEAALLDNRARIDRESFDLTLWGGIVSKPRAIGKAMAEIGYFGLNERDAPGKPTRNRNLHSFSARIIRDPAPGRIDFEAEAVYQMGRIRADLSANARMLDVSAWFAHVDIGYSFASAWKPRLSIEYDHASGDGRGRHFGRFDTLFGMRRADLGPAGIYAALGRTNISTPGVRIEASPSKRLDGFAVYRPLWLAARTDSFSTTGVRDSGGRSGRFAGHQIEGRVRYWLIDQRLRAECNAVWLIKGRFLETAPNAPATGDTHYASFALTASF